MQRSSLSLVSLVFLVALVAFGAGGWTALKAHPVWDKILDSQRMVTSLLRTGLALAPLAYFPRAAEAPPSAYLATDPDRIMPGYLAVARLDTGRPAYVVDLIDDAGATVHTWVIDYPTIAGEGRPLTFPHGHKLLPDGSLLVNFDLAYALARIDACGQPIWARRDGIYHHEISLSDGEYWTWFGEGGRVYDGNDLVRFDPETGETLERINLVDDILLASDANRQLAAVGPDHVFHRDALLGQGQDDYHPNDIEPLPADIAAAFPMFEAGDLLLSLRNLNMVAVMDRQTRAIKWQRQGPWIWQHDPDWHADGTISIYANNPERGRSEIYVIDPATGDVSAPVEHGERFYSNIMGTHQRLPNGNWLIVASRTGRVLEVTADGSPVREVHNIINDNYSAIVPHAEWVPADFFDAPPACNRGE